MARKAAATPKVVARTSTDGNRKRRERRKEDRPAEIIAAAIEVFGEYGFGAARLEDVALRAGVAKGTIFVYFANKNELFRAVAQTVLSTHLAPLRHVVGDLDRPLADLVPLLFTHYANVAEGPLPPMARALIAESRTFPDLARVWHDEVVSTMLGLITAVIERAQSRGEIRPGDPSLHAFSIMGPLMSGVIFREVFKGTGAAVPDLKRLASQHAETILHGLLMPTDGEPHLE